MQRDYITPSLGLPEFRILGIYEDEHHIIIYLEKKEALGVCPQCGRVSDSVHDRRVCDIQDIPLRGKGVILRLIKRRYLCQNSRCERARTKRPFAEKYESIGKHQRRTKRLNQHIYRLAKRMTFTDVARLLTEQHTPISDCTVGRIYHSLAEEELAGRKQPLLWAIGIDEFSIKKRHNYATVITDLISHKLVDTFKKRDKDTVKEHLSRLSYKDLIKWAVIDMSATFAWAIWEALPGARVVIDKFHVVKQVIEALDEVRKRIQRSKPKGEKRPIYNLRYKLRKGKEKLGPEEKAELVQFLEREPELKLAYELKESLRGWYELPGPVKAREGLHQWYAQVEQSHLSEFTEVVETFKRWEPEILNYFYWRFTNGYTEGLNNKIKVIKRQGYGFRNFANFRRRILVEAA